MPVSKLLPMLCLSTCLLVSNGLALADQCSDYARQSVAQQTQNVFNLCGYRGSHWSSDYQFWYQSCQSMSPKDIAQRLSMRDQFLQKCPEVNYRSVGRNRQIKLLQAVLYATKKGDIRLLETLIAEGVNLGTQPATLNASPLFIATSQNDLTLAKLLIRHGAKPYFLADGEENLLSLLIQQKAPNYAFLEFLLAQKANPNIAGNGVAKSFPLEIAAERGDFRSVNLLLSYKADPNRYFNRPPLHWAVEQDHYPIVRSLIKAGANPNMGIDSKVCDGKTALDLAFRHAKDRIIDLLLDNRALSLRECTAK